MSFSKIGKTLRAVFRKWQEHNITIRAAALAFFIILPLPSLLLIAISILAQIYGAPQALAELINQVSAYAGPVIADLVRQLLVTSKTPFTSLFASVTIVGFAIAGAVGAFAVLHETMNMIWEVTQPKHHNFIAQLKQELRPFLLISGLGIAVVVWTGITTILYNSISLAREPPGILNTQVPLGVINVVLSFALSVFLFAVIYKQLPDITIRWREIRLAAIIAAVAFTIAKYFFDAYVQTFTVTTVAGAAGALMVLLLWIFLMTQLLLFGAEFSKIYFETTELRKDSESPI